ncbi:putative methyltransferase PMT21 [Cocos nucifera]|uniref:Putative methyltransferase PMT21 n=1 Tax=Cocos nucifera TaxID=13894 RepID=A0A8K0MVC7_COCNU|nr:putative methyltransferase PMT21 [Cocos nucifera]
MLGEAAVKAVKDKVELIKVIAKEEKAKAVAEANLKGIEEYKTLMEFEDEVAEGSLVAYIYGFNACKACLNRMLSNLDLSRLNLKNNDDESRGYLSDEDELDQVEAKPTPVEIPTIGPIVEDTIADIAE